jgi:glucokinase
MILAGDVGGTKTLLGLFEPGATRPSPLATRSYATGDFASFSAILDAFARDLGRPLQADAAAIGVAGPVLAQTARLTNVAWDIAAADVSARLGTSRVALLNDLASMALSVEVLTAEETTVLQTGLPRADGNGVIIAAGTGLGQAYLHRVGGRFRPLPSEGGHADFAARTDREVDLMRLLRARFGRAEVEQVLSGPGLVNVHELTHADGTCGPVGDTTDEDAPARISRSGLHGDCARCVETMAVFVAAFGAETGNLALRGLATGGVWIGGGIAPKILPALQDDGFMAAFRDKTPMTDLLTRIPVKVILTAEAGLLGAAVHAQNLARIGDANNSPDPR